MNQQSFKDYLLNARSEFVAIANKYDIREHLKLRTAIDSLLIAYDQAVFFNEWNLVTYRLPPNTDKVLVLLEDDDNVYTMRFNPAFGWEPCTRTFENMSGYARPFAVKYWKEIDRPEIEAEKVFGA